MIYFDAAYIAKCYINEPGSHEVRSLAAKQDGVASCAFGRLELAAAIHRKVRENAITHEQSLAILKQLGLDNEDRIWTWLPVTSELVVEAAERFRSLKQTAYLRAGDGLHLACAMKHGFTEIWSNDRHLLAVAPAFELKGRNIIP